MSQFRFTKGIVSDVRIIFTKQDYRVLLQLLHELSWSAGEASWSDDIEALENLLSDFGFVFPITPDNAGQFIRSLVYLLSKRHVMLQGSEENPAARVRRPFGCLSTREVIMLSHLCAEYVNTDIGIYLWASNERLVLLPSREIGYVGEFYYAQHGWSIHESNGTIVWFAMSAVVTFSVTKADCLSKTQLPDYAVTKE